jgi:hypothetical protein
MRSIHTVAMAFLAAGALAGCPAEEGDGGGDDAGDDDGDGGDDGGDDGDGGAWRALPLPDTDDGILREGEDRITGFHCVAPDRCVVSTDNFDGGALFAANKTGITDTLIVSKDVQDVSATLGKQTFHGFDTTPMGVIARLSSGTDMVYAAGDPLLPASWTVGDPGIHPDGSDFGLTPQLFFRSNAAGNRWILWNKYGSYEASQAPGPTTQWRGLWSPQQNPPVPADLPARRRADPTLCNTEVGNRTSPPLADTFYIGSDLETIIYPSYTMNARGDDAPGACVSTDGGRSFHQAPLPAEVGEYGPSAIRCLDDDNCFAINGLSIYDNSFWIYRTTNASAGKDLTWTKATIPALPIDGVTANAIFFAPGGQRGFVVGGNNGKALLLATTDGGATWVDRSPELAALRVGVLFSGAAPDERTVWLGGVDGALLVSN